MTKVSVLFPVYNTKEEHLRAAMDSILNQTFKDFEFLIANDASTDKNVEKVIKSYADSRIRYIVHKRNLGISETRNKLIDLAAGEYLAVMDHDDISLPERFEKQVAFMDANPRVGICGTAYKRFGKRFKSNIVRPPAYHAQIKAMLFFKCPILHPSAMIRAAVVKKNNIRYDGAYISVNDRKLYADIAGAAELRNLPDVLFLYRLHNQMVSQTKRDSIKAEQKRIRHYFCQMAGASLPDDELDLLNDYFLNGRKIKSAEVLSRVEKIVSAVMVANEKSQYFPVEDFNRLCGEWFLKRCYKAAVLGGVSSKKILRETRLPVRGIPRPFLLRVLNFWRLQ